MAGTLPVEKLLDVALLGGFLRLFLFCGTGGGAVLGLGGGGGLAVGCTRGAEPRGLGPRLGLEFGTVGLLVGGRGGGAEGLVGPTFWERWLTGLGLGDRLGEEFRLEDEEL